MTNSHVTKKTYKSFFLLFIFYLLSFIFYLLSFIFYLLSFIFYLLSFIFYLLSFIFYLLSFIFYLLSFYLFTFLPFYSTLLSILYASGMNVFPPSSFQFIITIFCHSVEVTFFCAWSMSSTHVPSPTRRWR